ncbi:MAG TPA: hypothetical protein ENK42_03595 [Deltaproteobacteria bacterium]|nr:hypothetical protein [Deltaproteobacteria bacterium]
MKKRALKFLAIYLAAFMFMLNLFPVKTMAYVVGTGEFSSMRGEDMAKIQRVLETKIVKERLKEVGLTEEEVYSKLNALSDEELHSFAQNIESLYPGGDALGAIVGLLVVVILVLVILHLTDHKIVIEKDE